jgi:Bacterial protein of unknown function (DUF937)
MGLFDQIVGAIDNPNQQGSTNQLGSILSAVQQLSGGQGVDSSATQTMLSVVGNYVRSSLQQQRDSGGNERAQNIIDQFAGTQPNPAAPQALFSPSQQQQITQVVSQRTGLDPQMVQSLLPVVVPLILNLLNTGAGAQSQSTSSRAASNSVLSSFLDSDGDRDVDLGDAISLASQFLSQQQ